MRPRVLAGVVLGTAAAIAAAAHPQQEPIRATTEDGRRVVLHADGTWRYEAAGGRGSSPVRTKPTRATTKVDLLRGKVTLSYIPATWKPTPSDDPSKLTFQHANGDGYAMIIAERLEIPLPKLKDIAVANARQAAPNVRVTLEEEVRVNGIGVLAMQMEGTIQGIDFTYYGYYFSSTAGSVQVLTYTGRNLFPEFRGDFEEFLNGLQVAR